MADADAPQEGSPGRQPAAAPASLIIVGTIISVVSVTALVVADFRPPASVIGWVLAGPVAASLFIVYALRESRAKRDSQSATPFAVHWLFRLGLTVTCAAIVVNALSVGLWLGTL